MFLPSMLEIKVYNHTKATGKITVPYGVTLLTFLIQDVHPPVVTASAA